jgi:tetratricopeptide (TPR) repeat protein
MTARTQGRAFIVMPFGRKKASDGVEIDFNQVYEQLLKPAVEAAGLRPHRADAERRGGSIHADMFQDLLLAEFVVADLTVDNPNVWYEIGVRHALRSSGAVLTYALRDRLPFDLAGQRMQRYTLKDGKLDPGKLEEERNALTEAIRATLGAWRGRKASPVYAQLPNLREPDWKTLKVGDVNEFWQALEAWQSRVRVAQGRQRPGDILVLAEETPNRLLEFEALRTAAKALLDLRRARYALAVLEQARSLDPDDVRCRQLEGIALGRCERFEEAREVLRRLAEERRDGETLGLLARTWKDEWTRLWKVHPGCEANPVLAARDTAATLARAAEAYVEAFRADPADYYPGINALMLGRIWEHTTGRRSKLGLEMIAAGVRWAADCALGRDKSYWSLVTRAELHLIEGEHDAALDNFGEATALAVASRDRFALDSSSQTLDLLRTLGFRPEIVAEAERIIDAGERQLDALLGARPERPVEPARVVLFSGHMVDKPGRETPRFPEVKAEAAGARIAQELDALGVGPGDLGISQAASGGDLLFATACLARGMHLETYLPQREPEFLAASVSFAAPRWQRDYDTVKENRDVVFHIMPDELGSGPEEVDIYDRCNRWMLHSALSCGLGKVSFMTLWDGKPGDGPGGTEHMASLVRRLTGRQPAIIDPATL